VTSSLYPENAPGKSLAILSMVACSATICLAMFGAMTAYTPLLLVTCIRASRSPPVVPITQATPTAQYSSAFALTADGCVKSMTTRFS